MAEAAPKTPPEIIIRPKFEVITGGKKEPEKVAATVPPKRLGLKIGASIAGFFMGVTGTGVGLGETNKLPEPLQETYNQAFHKDRISYDENGTPVVDITTETTQAPETTALVVTETTSPITQETVPPTTEAIAVGPVEYEGVMINPIEGLRFDNGTFFAQEGNPYGLEAEAKAGVFVKDAFEMNGQMENSIGLRPEVIEILQQKYLEENKELKIPVFINLEKDKGVKIDLLINEAGAKNKQLENVEHGDLTFLAINAPVGTKIYSPLKSGLSGEYTGMLINTDENYQNLYETNIVIPEDMKGKISIYDTQGIDWGLVFMSIRNSELLATPTKDSKGRLRLGIEVGIPLFKIVEDLKSEELQTDKDRILDQILHGKYLLNFYFSFQKVTYNEDTKNYDLTSYLETGENIFLEIDKIKTFILPANDK